MNVVKGSRGTAPGLVLLSVLVLGASPGQAQQTDSLKPDSVVKADTAGGLRRPRPFDYSEGYGKRLAIHRVASYAELPLFAGEYILGNRLLNDERTTGTAPSGLRNAHVAVAASLGALFAVNTVTGVWNLLEARHDPNGRTRRTVHALGMLLADAGFLWTASLADGARESGDGATRHRNAAIASISVATASTLMMWLWKH